VLTRRTPAGEADGLEMPTGDIEVGATRGDGTHAIGDYQDVVLLRPDGGKRQLHITDGANGIGAIGLCDARPLVAVQCPDERLVRVIDWETGANLLDLQAPNYAGRVSALCFSQEGNLLAVIGSSANVYRLAAGERVLQYSPTWVQGVSGVGGWSGATDLWAAFDGALHRFDLARGAEVRASSAPDGRIAAVAWSQDGSRIAVARADGTVSVMAVEGGQVVRRLEQIEGDIWDIAFAVDDQRLLVMADQLLIFDLATGEVLHRVAVVRTNCEGSFAVSPDGKVVAVGGDTLLLVDVQTGELLKKLARDKNGIRMPQWSVDGKRLAAIQGDFIGKAVALDSATGKVIDSYKPRSQDPSLRAVAVFGDELAMLTGRQMLIKPLGGGSVKNVARRDLGEGGRPSVHVPSGQFFTSDFEGRALVISRSGDVVARFPEISATEAAFRPDGKAIALGDRGGVTIWSLAAEERASPSASRTSLPDFGFDGKRRAVLLLGRAAELGPVDAKTLRRWADIAREHAARTGLSLAFVPAMHVEAEAEGLYGFAATGMVVAHAAQGENVEVAWEMFVGASNDAIPAEFWSDLDAAGLRFSSELGWFIVPAGWSVAALVAAATEQTVLSSASDEGVPAEVTPDVFEKIRNATDRVLLLADYC